MPPPRLSLIVPFRDDDGSRGAIKDWILTRWAHHFPEAQIVVQDDDGGAPFSKTVAANLAFERCRGDLIGLLDSDVWIDPAHTREAIDLIASGRAHWVIPASRQFRLTEAATASLLRRDPRGPFPTYTRHDCDAVHKVWGLLHLFPRAAFEAIGGYDPRFRGWGGEDRAATAVMDTMWGPHTLLPHRIYHLRHAHLKNAAGERIWERQTSDNGDLRDRYLAAHMKPEQMRVLVDEVRALRSGGPDH